MRVQSARRPEAPAGARGCGSWPWSGNGVRATGTGASAQSRLFRRHLVLKPKANPSAGVWSARQPRAWCKSGAALRVSVKETLNQLQSVHPPTGSLSDSRSAWRWLPHSEWPPVRGPRCSATACQAPSSDAPPSDTVPAEPASAACRLSWEQPGSQKGVAGRGDEEPDSTSSPAAAGPQEGPGHSCPCRRYCCSGPAVFVVTSSVEPSSVAGTGTLWAGGMLAGFSPGGGQTGAVASGGPEERTMTLSRGSEGGTQGQEWPSPPPPPVLDLPAGQPPGREVDEGSLR